MNSDHEDDNTTKVVELSAVRRTKDAADQRGDATSAYESHVCKAQARVFRERLKNIHADLQRAQEREHEAVVLAQRAQAEVEAATKAVNALRRDAAELSSLKAASEQRAAYLDQHLAEIAHTRKIVAVNNNQTRLKAFGLLCIGWGFTSSAQPQLEAAGTAVILVAIMWLARHFSKSVGR